MIAVLSAVANRTCAMLVLVLSCVWSVADAESIRFELRDYLIHESVDRLGFFDGKLLTANDLDDEQSYKRSTTRYIHPVVGTLSELLRRIGIADIVLLLDEADIQPDKRSTPEPDQGLTDEDFIILDPNSARWRGRLFVPETGDIEPGIYDDLVGSFEGLVIRPTEIPAPALASGLLAMTVGLSIARRRIRSQNRFRVAA